MPILEVEHICKSFEHTEVLKDISFSLEKGQVVSIIGSSGSGKTTLLRCLNFLERPDKGILRVNGEVLFDGDDPLTMQESEIRKKRLHFGLVFQSFNLFPQYTAMENVMLAKELLAKQQPDYKAKKKEIHEEIEEQAKSLLNQMGFPTGGTTIPISSPEASASGWPLPGRLRCSRISSALTSPRPRWIRSSPGRS